MLAQHSTPNLPYTAPSGADGEFSCGNIVPIGSNFPDVITTGRLDVSYEVSSMIATNTILAVRQLPEEFDSIFREHSEFVYRTAYRVTGSAEDAEDVMQTVFLKLLRSFPSSDIRSKPKAYLYRAAVNTALNVVRSRQHHVLTDQSDSFESDAPWRQSDRESDMHECLRIALADLKPKAAEIFILRYVHGYSDAEIGELLGTSRGTIAISLFRSRARLRKSIRNYQGEQS